MSEVPIVSARFFVMLASHAAFFTAIAFSLLEREILIPLYLLVTFGLLVGLNWFEGARLGPCLKHRYPVEFEKLQTRSGYGYNSFRGLRFAFSGNPDDDHALKRLRRHWRRIWIEALSSPPLMFMIIVSAVSISK